MGLFASRPAEEPTELPPEFDPETVHVAPKIDIPLDAEDSRYVRSFRLEERDAYLQFFKEYGFVVVRDVLSTDECKQSVDDLWTFLETGTYKRWDQDDEGDTKPPSSSIKRNDPNTWNADWPRMAHAGILGFLPIFTKRALLNRQNPRVYEVFRSVMGRDKLMVSHDRYGMFRPVCNASGDAVNLQWKTSYSLHWDVNPWRFTQDDEQLRAARHEISAKKALLTYSNPDHFIDENGETGTDRDGYVGTQGIINFVDNLKEDGGFQLVVGFHKHLSAWAASTKDCLAERMMHRDLVKVCPEDPLYKQAQRVSLRAGSLVIWDQRMAHGSAPNCSANARFCQFLKMSSALDLSSSQAKHRAAVVSKKVAASGVEMTDLGKKLFGLKPW